MTAYRLSLSVLGVVWLGMAASAVPRAAGQYPERPDADVPTFARDVAPILYKHCTGCHREGEIAPMPLLSYEHARPWAKAIRDEVQDRHMPPWHAEAPHGTFLNERHLTDAEQDVLIRWADAGAPKGDPADMPPVPQYTEGWSIGDPDFVFEMPEDYKIPADGVIEYEYFYIPTNLTEPTWIQALEVRPGNRAVVHHVLLFYRAKPDLPRSPVLQFHPQQQRLPPRTPGLNPPRGQDAGPQRLLATYAPGTNPHVMPPGTALRLEPGGVLELQMHYTTTGEATTDRTRIGMILSRDASPREVRPSHFLNATLMLPAGASDVRIDAEVTFVQDATVWGLFPHTHLRGKRWEYVLELPDGTTRNILSVPRYDFNWQTYYMFTEPLQVPKGARIVSSAWYDNSDANRSNPDPKIDVRWGDQTWEEMQYTGILFSPSVAAPSSSNAGR